MLTRFFTAKELIVLVGIGVAVCIGGIAVYAARHAASHDVVVTQSQPDMPVRADIPAGPSPAVIPGPSPAPGPMPEPAAEGPQEPAEVVVSVMGEVLSPGVYTLPAAGRVEDLIDAAGGATEDADFSDINRAAPLIDGSTLTIPARAHDASTGGPVHIRRPLAVPPANPPQYTISGWHPSIGAEATGSGGATSGRGAAQTVTPGLIDLNRATVDQLQTLPGIGPKYAEAIVAYRAQRPFATVDDLQNVRGIGSKRLESLRPLVTVTR